MRRRTLVLAAVGVTAAVVIGGVTVVLRGAGPIATGYAAQIGCGVVLLQDRPVSDVAAELPSNPIKPLLRVDENDGALEASLLGLFSTRAAPAGDGGCRQLEHGEEVPVVTVPAMDPAADDLVVPDDPAATADERGVDVAVLDAAVDDAFEEDDDPETRIGTRAVVVVHDGTVVAERYAEGFGADTPLIGWSMTKSIADAITGRLVMQGLIATDDPVPATWPEDDPRSRITVEQLLRMTDGLAFEEVYDVGTDATTMLFTGVDTGEFAAEKPLEHPPGTAWEYSSGTSNILCDALVEVADAEPALLGRELVFEPLAMTSATIGGDGTAPVCSSFAYATARDWARFGLFYEQDGVWGGQRLLPEQWVQRTTTPVDVPTVDPDTGRVTPYGRHWWLNTDGDGVLRMPSVPADAFWASGNEGQQVVVVPSADLVVVRLGLTRGYDGISWGLEPLVAAAVDAVEGSG